MPGVLQAVELQTIGARLGCTAARVADLLAVVHGVEITDGQARIVDVELSEAVRVAFSASGEPKPLNRMLAGSVTRRTTVRR